MANRCAGLDPTWAHLPTPAPTHTAHAAASHYYCSSPAWLTSAAALENEALTSALRASMAPAHAYSAAASSFSSPATPSSSTSSASELLSSGHDAPAPAASSRPATRALPGAGPRGGRVTKKRKPRPSRRPQTTYITADAANFRRMVQEITGLSSSFPAASEAATVAAPSNWTPAPACVLPTLDTSAFLLDRAAAVPAPEEKRPGGGGHATHAAAVASAAGNDDSSALLELEALVCAAAGECGFPALESWGII